MKLSAFLAPEGRPKITLAVFGARVGVSAETIRRYAHEGRIPSPRIMNAIVRETEGAVQPNDFYEACGVTLVIAQASAA